MPQQSSRRTWAGLMAAVLMTLIAESAQADPMFNAINLIPGSVSDLNDSSQVVAYWGDQRPTVYDGYGALAGQARPAFPPSRTAMNNMFSGRFFLNNSGTVAATGSWFTIPGSVAAHDPILTTHAVVSNGQTTTDLGTLGGANGGSQASGINNAGEVVGSSGTSAGTVHAFIATNGVMTDLGTLPGGRASMALGINDAGQVVGVSQVGPGQGNLFDPASFDPHSPMFVGFTAHAVLFQNGKVNDLGTLGGTNSAATAINQSGAIVGSSDTASGAQHAFLYQNGQMHDLGTLNTDVSHTFYGVTYSQADAINNAGAIVGASNSLAFLDANGKMYNLNDLVHIPGVTLTSAFAINNLGQILANGYSSNGPDREWSTPYEFLLSPVGLPEPNYAVPEPSTVFAMAGLAAWLAVRGRVRRRGADRR